MTGAEAAFWQAWLASGLAPADAEARWHSAFGVGSGTDEGAALILSGRKTATSSPLAAFGDRGPPRPGDLSMLLGAGGIPRAIVETVWAAPCTLAAMDADFATAYAEWPDLEQTRAGLLDWYRQEDPAFTPDTPLWFERMAVVWCP
jgi:uncharacterized protein YhfF